MRQISVSNHVYEELSKDSIFQSTTNILIPFSLDLRELREDGENAEGIGTTFDDTKNVVYFRYRFWHYSMSGVW